MSAQTRAQTHKTPALYQHYTCIMTRWHWNAFRVAGPLWEDSLMTSGCLKIGQIMLDFDVSSTVNQNKLLSKQSYCQWYEMPQLMWRHRIGSSPTNRWAIQSADPELIYNVTYGLRGIVLFIKSFVWRFQWSHVIIQNQQASKFARLHTSCVLGYM